MQNPFEMKVHGMYRALADKVVAVCDDYLQGKVSKHSRNRYDIFISYCRLFHRMRILKNW